MQQAKTNIFLSNELISITAYTTCKGQIMRIEPDLIIPLSRNRANL